MAEFEGETGGYCLSMPVTNDMAMALCSEKEGKMKLQDKLDALKKDFESKVPKPALEIMHRATEDLRKSGILDRAVKVGDKAPDFTLKNTGGQEVSLSGLLSKGPVIVSFYRGKW